MKRKTFVLTVETKAAEDVDVSINLVVDKSGKGKLSMTSKSPHDVAFELGLAGSAVEPVTHYIIRESGKDEWHLEPRDQADRRRVLLVALGAGGRGGEGERLGLRRGSIRSHGRRVVVLPEAGKAGVRT